MLYLVKKGVYHLFDEGICREFEKLFTSPNKILILGTFSVA